MPKCVRSRRYVNWLDWSIICWVSSQVTSPNSCPIFSEVFAWLIFCTNKGIACNFSYFRLFSQSSYSMTAWSAVSALHFLWCNFSNVLLSKLLHSFATIGASLIEHTNKSSSLLNLSQFSQTLMFRISFGMQLNNLDALFLKLLWQRVPSRPAGTISILHSLPLRSDRWCWIGVERLGTIFSIIFHYVNYHVSVSPTL